MRARGVVSAVDWHWLVSAELALDILRGLLRTVFSYQLLVALGAYDVSVSMELTRSVLVAVRAFHLNVFY